jgi:hypothetical protein
MATDPSPATGSGLDDADHERIVVRLPLSVPTVIRMLAAFGQEFPGVRLIGDPAGADLVFEVPLDDPPRSAR